MENSVGKPNMSISKTEFEPESINDSRRLKSISLYNFYIWSWCAVEISTPPKKIPNKRNLVKHNYNADQKKRRQKWDEIDNRLSIASFLSISCLQN